MQNVKDVINLLNQNKMKIETNDDVIFLKEVYNTIILKTNEGKCLYLCMRDGGFEFRYQGEWYFAKEGFVEPFKRSSRGNLLVDQRHKEEDTDAPGPGTNKSE